MRDGTRGSLGQVLGGVALFGALMLFGLITRPLAGMLSGLYGFHAVLAALPFSFSIAFALRKGVALPVCFLAVAFFSAVLFSMSPIMGLSSLLPMIGAAFVSVAVGRVWPEWRSRAAGLTYGSLFYPCTLVVSGGFGVLTRTAVVDEWPIMLVSTLLGAVLALVGAVLASGTSSSN